MTNLSAVPTTPVVNLCHGLSVISGVVDTGDKFITGEQLSPVTTTPAIKNIFPVSLIQVKNLQKA
jgi:hypothetical protein